MHKLAELLLTQGQEWYVIIFLFTFNKARSKEALSNRSWNIVDQRFVLRLTISRDNMTNVAVRTFTRNDRSVYTYFNHFSESRSQMRCHPRPLLLQPFLQQHPKPSMWWPSRVCQSSSRYKKLSETQAPGTVTDRHCDHDHLVWHEHVLLCCTFVMALGNTLL